MKTRSVISDGETITITEHEPIRQGHVVLYQSNTCPERMGIFPNGVLKIGSKYYPIRTITESHSCLLKAICEICGRYDLVGIAWALSDFNLTLDDCKQDNPDETTDILIKATQLNMEGYPADQVDAVRKMADALFDKQSSVLYERIMRAVKSAEALVQV
ncbi:MAG: hypothetical protein UX81_C0034G0018 [Parcubacteria group bacterium GW2011_GWA2_47_12]|nr:MAG: hypothetical protein UX81_C0034G0018 [Parcubacteria group bacterium GW2011_GWA2_47_12]